MSGCTSTYGSKMTHHCLLRPKHDGDHRCRHRRTWSDNPPRTLIEEFEAEHPEEMRRAREELRNAT